MYLPSIISRNSPSFRSQTAVVFYSGCALSFRLSSIYVSYSCISTFSIEQWILVNFFFECCSGYCRQILSHWRLVSSLCFKNMCHFAVFLAFLVTASCPLTCTFCVISSTAHKMNKHFLSQWMALKLHLKFSFEKCLVICVSDFLRY